MILVQPEELSALMDGELDDERRAEVQIQIAAEPALKAAFEAMVDLDKRWRAAAREAAFVPLVHPLPAAGAFSKPVGPAIAPAYSILRIVSARTGVRFAGKCSGWNGWVAILVTSSALLSVRAAVRIIDPTILAFGLQALVLAAVLAWLARSQWSDFRSGVDPAG